MPTHFPPGRYLEKSPVPDSAGGAAAGKSPIPKSMLTLLEGMPETVRKPITPRESEIKRLSPGQFFELKSSIESDSIEAATSTLEFLKANSTNLNEQDVFDLFKLAMHTYSFDKKIQLAAMRLIPKEPASLQSNLSLEISGILEDFFYLAREWDLSPERESFCMQVVHNFRYLEDFSRLIQSYGVLTGDLPIRYKAEALGAMHDIPENFHSTIFPEMRFVIFQASQPDASRGDDSDIREKARNAILLLPVEMQSQVCEETGFEMPQAKPAQDVAKPAAAPQKRLRKNKKTLAEQPTEVPQSQEPPCAPSGRAANQAGHELETKQEPISNTQPGYAPEKKRTNIFHTLKRFIFGGNPED